MRTFFANDEILTIKDLFELHLAGGRLATLSVCETGVSGFRMRWYPFPLPSSGAAFYMTEV